MVKEIIACRYLSLLLLLYACGNKPSNGKIPWEDTAKSTTVRNNSTTIALAENKYAAIDVSPMDMAYYPVNYPQLKTQGQKPGNPVMRIIYSRPHLQGRKLFPDVLKYDQIWRMGANEATELQVYDPVIINNKKLEAGRYTLYAIPHQNNWTIAFNRDTDVWGLQQDSTKDVLRATTAVTHNNPAVDYLTIVFEGSGKKAAMVVAWDTVVAKLPIQVQ